MKTVRSITALDDRLKETYEKAVCYIGLLFVLFKDNMNLKF